LDYIWISAITPGAANVGELKHWLAAEQPS
jgi:hypothetical protein